MNTVDSQTKYSTILNNGIICISQLTFNVILHSVKNLHANVRKVFTHLKHTATNFSLFLITIIIMFIVTLGYTRSGTWYRNVSTSRLMFLTRCTHVTV